MIVNNIEDISTKNLKQMLELKRFLHIKEQIKDELNFRQNGLSFEEMTNIFKHGKTN
jgi:hypothetical protein